VSEFSVTELRIGRVGPLGPKAVPSGIDKAAVAGPLMARGKGFEGDEQGDTRHPQFPFILPMSGRFTGFIINGMPILART